MYLKTSGNKNLGKNEFKICYFFHTYCQYCQLGFSSEIEVPRLGSAWAGKFQLGLITIIHRVEDLGPKALVDHMNHLDLGVAISIGIDLRIQDFSILFLIF